MTDICQKIVRWLDTFLVKFWQNFGRILPLFCQKNGKILPKCCQNFARKMVKFFQNAVKILPEKCQVNIRFFDRFLSFFWHFSVKPYNLPKIYVHTYLCWISLGTLYKRWDLRNWTREVTEKFWSNYGLVRFRN